jgi:hypothetical protein
MINIFDAAVADATVALSPVLDHAPVGTPVAGSVAQTWISSVAFGPMHQSASAAYGSNSAHDAVAPGAKVVPAARRHRAPGASVLDSRYRLHCR